MARALAGLTSLVVALIGSVPASSQELARRERIEVTSSLDGSTQPANLFVPLASVPGKAAPLAVLLHTWSFDLDQRHPVVEREAASRGWLLLAPNFRGRNDHPEACGSRFAQQDVLDAVQWVRDHYPVDRARIYLLGVSGGAHMTMLMVGRAPELWAAASAWVGISDLAAYYVDHQADGTGAMIRKCTGGPPSQSASVQAEYRARSPLTRLADAARVPLDIAAGRFDDDVSFAQSVWAFNALAKAHGAAPVTDAELAALAGSGAGLLRPSPSDTASDPGFGREIFLRRTVGPSRLTIFRGGHEWLPLVAVSWLADHRRP